MIIDCFTYFNEEKLLFSRIAYLKDVVDRFVIVEGDRTFQGTPKESRLPVFDRETIRHIIVPLSATPKFSFQNEYAQRNAIMKGLFDASPDDLILIGDVDEIPNKDAIIEVAQPHAYLQKYYKYRRDLRVYNKTQNKPEQWRGTVALPFKQITSPQDVRDKKWIYPVTFNGGWHLSWMDNVNEKLGATSHNDLDTPENRDEARFAQLLKKGIDPLDSDKVLRVDKECPSFL